jgi:hypothetical protein
MMREAQMTAKQITSERSEDKFREAYYARRANYRKLREANYAQSANYIRAKRG